jgi:hypothetical protein
MVVAVLAMRLPVQPGHAVRGLQENATRRPCPQASRRGRASRSKDASVEVGSELDVARPATVVVLAACARNDSRWVYQTAESAPRVSRAGRFCDNCPTRLSPHEDATTQRGTVAHGGRFGRSLLERAQLSANVLDVSLRTGRNEPSCPCSLPTNHLR